MKRPRPTSTATASSPLVSVNRLTSASPPRKILIKSPPYSNSNVNNSDTKHSSTMKTTMATTTGTNNKNTQLTLNLDEPIPLTALEQQLFDLLLSVSRQPSVPPVTLRVAGGWVRDKILFPGRDLGNEVDIDIALDTMLGNDFAELVNKYMRSLDMTTASVGLIQKNPDQSKHLETATMRVLGIWLDLVNLRTETYSHDSRIPDVQIGTPLEDALRRDLTINSLYYNVRTKELEDFTGKGFDDIRARVIRTPLPPLTTLLDDPLRALRAVRFAARLNFGIDNELVNACKQPDVHEALAKKVSRERISGELHRILADGSQNPPHAVALLVEFGLFPVVVRMPSPSSLFSANAEKKSDLPPLLPADMPMEALSALINLHSLDGDEECWMRNDCSARVQLLRYAALLSPVAELKCMHKDEGKKNAKEMSVAMYVMRVELRLGVAVSNGVCALLDGAKDFKQLVHEGTEKFGAADRLRIAHVMKKSGGNVWRSALRIALIMELPVVRPEESFAKVLDNSGGRIEFGEEAKVAIKTYKQFKTKVEELCMEGVWDLKPVVNGNELGKLLPGMEKGPMIGKIMKNQVGWMIQNPGKSKEDMIEWIKKSFPEMT